MVKGIPCTRKQEGIAILTTDKIDFRLKLVRRHEEKFILINGTTNQEGIILLNIHALNREHMEFHKTNTIRNKVTG